MEICYWVTVTGHMGIYKCNMVIPNKSIIDQQVRGVYVILYFPLILSSRMEVLHW